MNLALLLIKFIVMVWDFLTYPIYQFVYQPWVPRKKDKEVKSKVLNQYTTDSRMVFESPEKSRDIYTEFIKSKATTMAEAFSWAVATYKDEPLLGTREILKEEDEVQSNGKMFRKYHLGDYRLVEQVSRNQNVFCFINIATFFKIQYTMLLTGG